MPEPLRTFVFSLFGLAFVAPAVVYLAFGRSSRTNDGRSTDAPAGPPLSWLAWFALAYGGATWMYLAVAGAGPDSNLRFAPAVFTLAAYLALVEYARVAQRCLGRKAPDRWIHGAALACAAAGAFAGPDGLLAASAWAIALPAGLAGADATIRFGGRRGAVGGWWLRTLGLLMGLFAVSAAAGAPPAAFPPALWVNHETFRSRFDVSVQHLRAFWAVLGAASLAGWGRKAAPATTRRLGQVLLATLASLLLLGASTAYYRSHLLEEEHLKAERAARDVARTVENAVRADIDGLEHLAVWTEAEGGPALEGEALPDAMRRRFPLLAAGIAQTDGQIMHVALMPRARGIVTYPPLEGTDALARSLLSAFRLAERRAEAATDQIRRPVLTGPILRSDGLPMLLGARTVVTKYGPWGVVAVTMDLRTQFEDASRDGDQSFAFALSDGSGRYVTGAPSSMDQTPETAEVSLLGAGWRVEALPPEGWDARAGRGMLVFLLIGLLVAGLASAGTLALSFRWNALARRSERHSRELDAVIAQSRDALAIVDGRGHLILANPALAELTGYQAAELDAGRFWRVLFPDEQSRHEARARARPSVGGDGESQEYEIQTNGGEARWVSVMTTPIDVDGHEYQLISARDITEHKRREVERSAILDAHEDGLLLVDREFTVIWANARVTGATGSNRLVGSPCYRALYRLDGPCSGCPATEAMGSGRPVANEIVRTVGSRERTWEMRAVPVSLGHLPASAIIWSREITQRKEVEARLRQAQKMEAVGQLAGGIAHDFNNILTGVIGTADLLLEQLEEATTPHDDAKEIRSLAARAADLTGQLLTFSRQQPLELSPLDLGAVLEEMRLMLGRLIGSHIRLSTRLPREPMWVLADPAQLQQIVLNLALNARDVMPDGGDLTITLRKRPWPHSLGPAPHAGTGAIRRRAACLEVSDTGPGIDNRIRGRIFEPFFTTKPVGQGTGLGLATVYGIVEQLGGAIDTSSTPGEGATFQVWLPLVSEAPAAEAVPLVADPYGEDAASPSKRAQPAAPARPDRSRASRRPRVLVVEDERAVRLLVGRILGKSGLRVVLTEDPEAALSVFRREGPFDLVVSDILMPVMRGTALVTRLRALDPELPAILISGYTDEPLANLANEPRVLFVPKPFTAAQLTAAVCRLLPDLVDAGTPSGD